MRGAFEVFGEMGGMKAKLLEIAVAVHRFYEFFHRPWRCLLLGRHKWSPITKVDGKDIVYVVGNDEDGYRVRLCCEKCLETKLDDSVYKDGAWEKDKSLFTKTWKSIKGWRKV